MVEVLGCCVSVRIGFLYRSCSGCIGISRDRQIYIYMYIYKKGSEFDDRLSGSMLGPLCVEHAIRTSNSQFRSCMP